MTQKKILITGGAGFIGSHLVDKLLTLGHEVIVVDDIRSGRLSNVPDNLKVYRIDIADPSLEEVFNVEKPVVVFHMAAQISVQRSMQDPIWDAYTNIRGSLNVLQNCVKYGVSKLIYASSGGAIYGEPESLPCDETHPVRPLSNYGVSKFTVENYLRVYREAYNLDYSILRLSNVYGPRQDPFGEAGVIAIFCLAMLKGEKITINGSGFQERDFVYVLDVVEGAVKAMECDNGFAFNIATGVGTSINQIFSLLRTTSEYSIEADYGPPKSGEVFKIYLDIRRAYDELGWEPRYSLEQGISDTLEWFKTASWD